MENNKLEEPHLTLRELEKERLPFTAPGAFCFPALETDLVDSSECHSLLKISIFNSFSF